MNFQNDKQRFTAEVFLALVRNGNSRSTAATITKAAGIADEFFALTQPKPTASKGSKRATRSSDASDAPSS